MLDIYSKVAHLGLLSVGFLANVLVIIAHVLDPFRVFRNASSMFVLNITIIDCSTALLWLIVDSLMDHEEFKRSIYYTTLVNVGFKLATMSGVAYLSLALELYFSISRPLWHLAKVTRQVCRNWIILTWFFHFILHEVVNRFLPSVKHLNLFMVSYTLSFFFAIQSLNLATFVSLRKQNKALRERRDVSESTVRAWKRRQKDEKRFLMTTAILSIFLTVSYCPYIVLTTLLTLKLQLSGISLQTWLWLDWMSRFMIMVNIFINPFFYLWRLPKYRKTFNKLFCKCLK